MAVTAQSTFLPDTTIYHKVNYQTVRRLNPLTWFPRERSYLAHVSLLSGSCLTLEFKTKHLDHFACTRIVLRRQVNLGWVFCITTKDACEVMYSLLPYSMDCNPPGSYVHGISPARILEWVAYPFSRGTSWIKLESPALAGGFFTTEPPGISPQKNPIKNNSEILKLVSSNSRLNSHQLIYYSVKYDTVSIESTLYYQKLFIFLLRKKSLALQIWLQVQDSFG